MEELLREDAAKSCVEMETLANWARRHGLSYDQYIALRNNIRRDAEQLRFKAWNLRQKPGAGTYSSIEELIPEDMRRRYERQGLLQYLHMALHAHGVGRRADRESNPVLVEI